MVANGANAGNLSPISAIGVVANTKMAEAGLAGHGGKVWLASFLAHALVSAAAYVVLAGQQRGTASEVAMREAPPVMELDRRHWFTIAIIVAWIVGVVALKLHVGMAAFAAAAVLVLARADEQSAVRQVPWGVIVMVCGVTVLIALLKRTGGSAVRRCSRASRRRRR